MDLKRKPRKTIYTDKPMMVKDIPSDLPYQPRYVIGQPESNKLPEDLDTEQTTRQNEPERQAQRNALQQMSISGTSKPSRTFEDTTSMMKNLDPKNIVREGEQLPTSPSNDVSNRYQELLNKVHEMSKAEELADLNARGLGEEDVSDLQQEIDDIQKINQARASTRAKFQEMYGRPHDLRNPDDREIMIQIYKSLHNTEQED